MIRTVVAGVDYLRLRGATSSTGRKLTALQAISSSRGPRDRQEAVCRRGQAGRYFSFSQEASEEKHTAAEVAGFGDVGVNIGGLDSPSSVGGEIDAENTSTTRTLGDPVGKRDDHRSNPGPGQHKKQAKGKQQQPRTFVVQTPNSRSTIKVAVPKTTAEAMAMNAQMKQEAAKMAALNAENAGEPWQQKREKARGRERPRAEAAAAAGEEAAASERPKVPSVMIVTPNARSKSIQMNVPRTTAECIELNKAFKERYSSETKVDVDSSTELDGNYLKRWRNPPALGLGGESRVASGTAGRSSSGMLEFAQVGPASGEPNYDQTLGKLRTGMRWEQIIRVWAEIEEKEKNGDVVKLGPGAYEVLMTAFIAQMDTSVVAKCGRVFDHLVASGQDIRPAMYNLYIKGCAVAMLGTRAVALIESLDRLPGKRYKPNPQFFFNLLMATCGEGMVAESKLYYGVMKDMGFEPSHNVFQVMLDMFLRHEGRMVDAIKIVEESHQAGVRPKDILMNKLAYTCMRRGGSELMHKTVDLLLLTGNVVNKVTVKNILYMARRRRDEELATKIWVAAQQWGHRFSQADYSFMVQTFFAIGKDDKALATLVQAYKDGSEVTRQTLTFCAQRLAVSNKRLDQAYYTLLLLKENGEPVPVQAVNAIVVGCAIRQSVDRCFATAEALPAAFGLAPDLDTYNALMHVLGSTRSRNETLGIGMSLLDRIEKDEVKINQETFMSLVDLACMSPGLTEDFANKLVERMTSKHDVRLEQDIVDTLASAFEDRGMHDAAQRWVDKMPPLDTSSPLATAPAVTSVTHQGPGGNGVGGARARRVAQDRGRYTGFDDGKFRSVQNSLQNQMYGGGQGRAGDWVVEDSYSREAGGGSGDGGSPRRPPDGRDQGRWAERASTTFPHRHERGEIPGGDEEVDGGSRSRGRWVDKYTSKGGK